MSNTATGDYSTGNRSTGAPLNRGLLDRGLLDRAPLNRGPLDRGLLDRGLVNRAPLNRVPLNRRLLDRGLLDRGLLDRGPLDRVPLNRKTTQQEDCSTGGYSTGYRSTGSYSTGDWSTSNYSTGHFSTEDYSGFGCFDKPCTLEEWNAAYKPSWLYFYLTEWVPECDMTDEEKESKPTYDTTGGYLKVYDYKAAFQSSYNEATREEQLKIKELPSFDADKFYQISGIRIDEEPAQEKSKDRFVTDEDGKKYKLVEVDNE
jgi:hypothetical protein